MHHHHDNSTKKIFQAFLLNLLFSVFEFFGGIFSGSVAILSDSIHDLGDAVGIGFSYALEKISKKDADDFYTFGYKRFSSLGAFITHSILIIGSVTVTVSAVERFFNPRDIKSRAMIILAIFGFFVNLLATILTKDSHSSNQRAVNLHMLEDTLGWFSVLIGAVIMHFTKFYYLDPILSILVALFILIEAIKGLKPIINQFLLKSDISKKKIENTLADIAEVSNIRILPIDENTVYAFLRIKTDSYKLAEKRLNDLGISQVFFEDVS